MLFSLPQWPGDGGTTNRGSLGPGASMWRANALENLLDLQTKFCCVEILKWGLICYDSTA